MRPYSLGIFGEVLFDHFPDGSKVLGGAPFNVAWHMQAFAQNPIFISRVGSDQEGMAIGEAMQDWGMETIGIQTDMEFSTGKVSINLEHNEPSYDIVDQQAYDFISPAELPDRQYPILYHGSLALRHSLPRQALTALKSRHRGLVFMDVNLRTPWWDMNTLTSWMAEADWIKLNRQELLQLLAGDGALESKMRRLKQDFQLTGLVVTCGADGALALAEDDSLIEVRPEIVTDIVDSVGAGDAFTAVLLTGILKDWPLQLAMQRAQRFASAMVQQRGAIVRNHGFYKQFVREWRLG